MNLQVEEQLSRIGEVVDQRIDKKLDQFQVESKRIGGATQSKKTLQSIIRKGLIENKGNRDYVIKANELFISEVDSGTFVGPMYLGDIKNEPFQSDLRAIFPQGSTESNAVTVNRGVYNTNSAAITVEGAQAPESTNDTNAVNFAIDKLAHRFSVSTEFLDDVDGASQFISSQIMGGLIEKINGNLVTDLKANDTAFVTGSGGALYQSIDSAQEFDVLIATLNQLRLDSYRPDAILLNPTDYAKIALLKDSQNNYLHGSGFSGVNPTIDGISVTTSSAITAGEFHVLDSVRFGRYYNRIPLSVEIGLDGSDFSSGTRTALAVHRGTLAVFDIKACVSGTFSTAKTALETP